jgi:predicted MFS family arabinose efflux permease
VWSSVSDTAPLAQRTLRTAHVSLAFVFVAFGTVDGAWAARLPALKNRLGLDSGTLGLIIFCVSLTATVLLPVAGWLASRFGSRAPSAWGLLLCAGGLTLAGFAPSAGLLATGACVIGAGIGVVDVAANAHGVAIEQRVGRPVLSALHAAWSLGLLTGSGIAAGAAASSVGPRMQFPLVAAGVVAASALCVPRLLPGTRADVESAHFALPRGALALPAFLTFCSMFTETAAMNWSAVFLSGPAHAGAAVAAAGVVAYSVAMVAARLVGDPLTARWGVGGIARRGGALTCGGIVLAMATRSPIPSLAGFALVGAGCAAIVPALFRCAAAAPGVSHGAGIAAVATTGYAGGVLNGPAIGFLARGIGLTAALGTIGVAGALIALLGPRLER